MNKRLIECANDCDAIPFKWVNPEGMHYVRLICKAQDAKTLKATGKGLEKVIRSSILTDDGWVYTIPKDFVEGLKEGRMPE